MATITIVNYNNYYNRLIKPKYNLVSDYLVASPNYSYTFSGCNFNPNDGIDTVLIVGTTAAYQEFDGKGDYLLVSNEQTQQIESRWFIIECKRTRGGQYEVQLHRDVITDYKELILTSPVFVEKATLEQSDPMIFNTEDMTFNQIKTSETLLKDETGCPWIVGFMSSKPFDINGQAQDKISSKIEFHLPVDETYASLDLYPYYQYSDIAFPTKPLIGNPTAVRYCVWIRDSEVKDGGATGYKFAFNQEGSQNTGILDATGVSMQVNHLWFSSDDWDPDWQCPLGPGGGGNMIWQNSLYTTKSSIPLTGMLSQFKIGFSNYYSTLRSQLSTVIPVTSVADVEKLNKENGKTIYVEDTKKYYTVEVKPLGLSTTEVKPGAGSLYNTFVSAYNNTVSTYDASNSDTWAQYTGLTAGPNTYSFSINVTAPQYAIYLRDAEQPSLNYEIQIDNERYHLSDAPYDMFCIPFSDELVVNKNGTPLFTSSKELAFQTAMALGRDYMGANYIYDLQIVPYCPVRFCIDDKTNTFDIRGYSQYFIKSYDQDGSYDTGTPVGVVLFASTSSFTLNIPFSIEVTNRKLQSQYDSWRLCSPNYNGLFEFNAAKNDGVDYINVDCTYKPYNPYIHLNPNFKGLYGQDFNDARGLICGGDFSLPNVTDSWRTYELNNKNYQNSFDRQMQSLDLRNSIQRTQDIVSAFTGSVTGTTSGAIAGSAAGPWGAAIGGVIGGTASLVGGLVDADINKTLRNDAMDLAKDQFGYSLGNIKALPYSLSKTSAYVFNNKYFPFLEYYTCTDQEKLALQNKLKYNGMTVMRIGTIQEFIKSEPSYIKGKLIRLEGVEEDFHVINTIASELNKGVFI